MNEPKATPARVIPDLWAPMYVAPGPTLDSVDIDSSLTRHLSDVEIATIRVAVAEIYDLPLRTGVLTEACWRLSTWDRRDLLRWASGFWIARELQRALGNAHPFALKRARWGLELLAKLDASDLPVEVTLSATPHPDPLGRYRRMRLKVRLAELGEV